MRLPRTKPRSNMILTPMALLASQFFVNMIYASETQLEPLKVSVTKTAMAPEEVAASISIITAEEIRQSGATDLVDAVRRTAGVSIGANSSSISGRKVIIVRGMDSAQSLIMIDGKRVTNTDAQVGHSNFQLNWVPIESIEHIEVVRGPMSSLYGSSGMAGVINIVTKKPGETWQSAVDFFYGDIAKGKGGKEYLASLNTRGAINEHIGLKLTLEGSRTKATEDKDGDTDRKGVIITEMEGLKIGNIDAGLVFNLNPEHKINLDVVSGIEERHRVESQYYDIKKHLYSLGYQGKFGDLDVDIKAYESYSDNYIEDYNYHHYLTDQAFTADFIKPLSETNQLIFGFEKRVEEYDKDYDDSSKTGFQNEIDYNSVFVQDFQSFLDDKLGLTLGLRYDKHENFGSELSPKLYLDYSLNHSQRLSAGYGHGFKAPTVTQSSDNYSSTIFHAGNVFIGNSDLKPEQSDSFEISWSYNKADTKARATLFYNDITDLIDTKLTGETQPITGFRIFKYSNVSEAKTQGLELEFSRPLGNGFNFDANYTFLDSKDGDNDSKQLKNRSRHTANLLLSHFYTPWNLTTSLNWEYIGSQYLGDGETERVPSYSLLDLTFTKDITKTIEVRGGITNIGDVRLKDKDDNFDGEERGRFYYVGIRKTF